MSVKQRLSLYSKNCIGWSTRRKIVVFAVDDYGNIRMASRQAFQKLTKAGLRLTNNRFDKYDSLETQDDLELLFETLTSVRDKFGRPAVFTAFAVPANINFELMERTGYTKYYYQTLPETFRSVPGYEGAWRLWKEGISRRLLVPQYHGREHVNVAFLEERLAKRDPKVLACLKERSWAGLDEYGDRHFSYVSAFSFRDSSENERLASIVADGLNVFEKVFGYRATHFNSPGSPAHSALEKTLALAGVRYIDTSFLTKEHQGSGKYRYRFNFQGKGNRYGQRYVMRNCVFEPLSNIAVDSVNETLAEIEIAFRMNKPAVVSSHRVNFCGHIDEKVRAHGLRELRRLLQRITAKWPDVEFMAANELGDLIASES